MMRPCYKALALACLPLLGGCGDTPPAEAPLPTAPGPVVGGGPPPPPGTPSGPVADEHGHDHGAGIGAIMTKLAKGPNSLTPVLGKELAADPVAWETVLPQAKEYAHLASEMGGFDPPKGAKDSWAKLTGAYAQSAADLEKAAEKKDKDAALAAHKQLANSCMTCHQAHRVMGARPRRPGRSRRPRRSGRSPSWWSGRPSSGRSASQVMGRGRPCPPRARPASFVFGYFEARPSSLTLAATSGAAFLVLIFLSIAAIMPSLSM